MDHMIFLEEICPLKDHDSDERNVLFQTIGLHGCVWGVGGGGGLAYKRSKKNPNFSATTNPWTKYLALLNTSQVF